MRIKEKKIQIGNALVWPRENAFSQLHKETKERSKNCQDVNFL